MNISDLSKFKNALIIDFNGKCIYVIKDGKIKYYPEKYYKELLGGLDLMNFWEDTE